MARTIAKLTALGIARTTQPGNYADGGGLYLQVTKRGAKSWIYKFMISGRAREMGLGPLHAVSLSAARAKAADCRRARIAGTDPIEARKRELTKVRLAAAKSITFAQCAEAYLVVHSVAWRSAKYAKQWGRTMERYSGALIGSLPVQDVDVSLVMKVLEPIWMSKPETATRMRERIEQVLDWAKVRGYREKENPARWRGHLQNLLPNSSKVRRVKHHPALPYAQVAEFMATLRKREGVSAAALEFAILTAARTSEVIGATWDEIDVQSRIWSVPAARMKANRDHRVPLSANALSILKRMHKLKQDNFVFPSGRVGRPLSNMAFLALLKRMDRGDITPHGFRSTFRDWTAEQTDYAREVAEMALGHSVGNQVEAAYRRGDLFEKRQRLMDGWAEYCALSKRQVIPIEGLAA